ncbi:hypothetical protein DXG03_007187 [Asterophora parasitica]|uniref:Cytochrome P450 n=1 Tax=Asterophora parasitica TaxID=117018 RepID=A0A9P7G0U5_9AGAR|nr:hypothetical protein DXG03_007187 [Asterophora parasitica]
MIKVVLRLKSCAQFTHLIFKRTETHEPLYLVALLLGVPAALTSLLVPHGSSIIVAGIVTFLTFWGTLGASVIAYRLSPWHPLAKYPGPLACKASKLWLAFIALRGKQHTYYAKLHDQYGDVVRIGKSPRALSIGRTRARHRALIYRAIGPNELSIRDVAAIAPMMGPHGLPKGPFWDGRVPEAQTVKPLLALRDKTEHTRRRRPWTRAFSTAALKGYEHFITIRSVQLVEALENQPNGEVDFAQWLSFFSYDLINDLAWVTFEILLQPLGLKCTSCSRFGGGSEMIRDGDIKGMWHLMEASQRISTFMSHVPWLGALFFRFPNVVKNLKAFRENCQNCAIARKNHGSPHKDIFHHLVRRGHAFSSLEEKTNCLMHMYIVQIDEDGVSDTPPTMAEIVSDGGLAIIAGSDTISNVVTNLFYFLISNPTAYKRLQAEIDELGDQVTDYAKQAPLPYLNAAINESLRLFPPVLSGSQRHTDINTAIGPYYVPAGTSTFVPSFSLQRNPRYFSPLPNTFLPERWLPYPLQAELEPELFSDHENVVLNTNAFVPFSVGPSNCVGKNLAWMEMRMVVCLLIQAFEVRFAEGYDTTRWYEDMMDYFVIVKGELPVVLTPRKHK